MFWNYLVIRASCVLTQYTRPCFLGSTHACRHAVFGLASFHVPDDAQQLYFCTVSWVAFPRPRSTKHSTWGWRASRGLLGLSDVLSGPNPDGPLYWERYLNTISLSSSSVIRSRAWRLLRRAVTNLSFCMMCALHHRSHALPRPFVCWQQGLKS